MYQKHLEMCGVLAHGYTAILFSTIKYQNLIQLPWEVAWINIMQNIFQTPNITIPISNAIMWLGTFFAINCMGFISFPKVSWFSIKHRQGLINFYCNKTIITPLNIHIQHNSGLLVYFDTKQQLVCSKCHISPCASK